MDIHRLHVLAADELRTVLCPSLHVAVRADIPDALAALVFALFIVTGIVA